MALILTMMETGFFFLRGFGWKTVKRLITRSRSPMMSIFAMFCIFSPPLSLSNGTLIKRISSIKKREKPEFSSMLDHDSCKTPLSMNNYKKDSLIEATRLKGRFLLKKESRLFSFFLKKKRR